MRTAALYGTLGSLVLSGLTGIPVAAAPALVPGGVAEARGVAVAAAQAAAAGIDFGACPAVEQLPSTVECGTFSVPVDYAHPGGRHIRLTVSRARAQGSARQGALVLNPGGPGGNGMFYPLVARLPAWRNIADAYDIIGYAPRGVGRSAPLSCVDPASYVKGPTQAPEHPSAAYKKERIAEARAYAQGCARKAGGSLRHFTSLNNARDLDVLRAALGEQKLTYMGASYGTYFGALYATLFPGHVRRMVFDSVVNPDPRKIWYGNNLEQSAAFERRFGDWRRWVARHDSAYHLGRTPQQVLGSYEKVSRRLSRRAAGGNVGPAQLQGAFLKSGYSDSYWARDARALAAFLHGDEAPLLALAAPDAASAWAAENENAVYTAVECNDASWPRSWSVWNRDNDRLAERAPFETWSNAFMNLPCAFWQGPRQRPADIRADRRAGLPPTLLLAAERDAATPYKGALELQRRLARSSLVTERGAGNHGIGAGPNACVNRYLDNYLVGGELPARRVYCGPRPEPRATA
ncbi:pimeloyl-ACP methyl ester carboxylesterase [Streptomyces olivoverticillatus]|uniref:Pimeloyl-ACP methyl ester carboxylesterase n=1 Tax=Streptomyces olivoverticillatus TaxID=66427 RepID=A0A7W7PMS2_9ACTN|nr:pimeloyl-ACP methyl ester carboxylesterase [Streptomyces olivoverticillatus]